LSTNFVLSFLNIAVIRKFEGVSVPVEVMDRRGTVNSIFINLKFLLASPYRLKHLKQSGRDILSRNFLLVILTRSSGNQEGH
jgi:hypothetical protein